MTEVPVYLPTSAESLAGLVGIPNEPTDTMVVLLCGRTLPRTHRNRMWTLTARSLRDEGAYTLTVDMAGRGDSQGLPRDFTIEHVPGRQIAEGVQAAVDRLGIETVLIAGTCSGARTALAVSEHVPQVKAVFFAAAPILSMEQSGPDRVIRKARLRLGLEPRQRPPEKRPLSPSVVRQVSHLLGRGGRIRLLYGEHEEFVRDAEIFMERLAKKLAPHRDRWELQIAPGREIRKFRTLDLQAFVVAEVIDWVRETRKALAESADGDRHAPTAR